MPPAPRASRRADIAGTRQPGDGWRAISVYVPTLHVGVLARHAADGKVNGPAAGNPVGNGQVRQQGAQKQTVP
jgi:hypothetical protein